MEPPLQVTFHGVPHSDAIDAYVRKRSAKLDTFSTRITACRVAVEAPHLHRHGGHGYKVRIRLTLPRGELVVSHAAAEKPTTLDAYAAIDHAFDQMGRRLEDFVRRRRQDFKAPAQQRPSRGL
jgi:ribosomal subunit interface protein